MVVGGGNNIWRGVFLPPLSFFSCIYLFSFFWFFWDGGEIYPQCSRHGLNADKRRRRSERRLYTHTHNYILSLRYYYTGSSFFPSFSSQTSQRVQSVVCCRSEWPLVTLTPLLHHQHPIRLLRLLPLQQQRNSGGWECAVLKLIIYFKVFSIIRRNIFTH